MNKSKIKVTKDPAVATQELVEQVRYANVVFAKPPTGEPYLVYGRETLERVAKSGDAEMARILTIPVDAVGDLDLEFVLAACLVAHGSHDYETVADAAN